MKARPMFWEATVRVCRRPWPLVIRYVGALVPAFLVALMLLIPLRSWMSQPLVVELLETRSLDLLFDALMHLSDAVENGFLLPVGMIFIPLIWVGLRISWLLLEGGVLLTYAQCQRPTVREFVRACIRWFPSFLLISVVALLASGVVVGIAAAGVALVRGLSLWPTLGTLILVTGMVMVVGISVAVELARAAAVVGADRNVWRAMLAAGRAAVQRFPSLVTLILGTLLLRVILFLVQRAVSGWIPLSWWLLTLLVQQLFQVLVTFVGLVRRAGEVALVYPTSAADFSISEASVLRPFDV